MAKKSLVLSALGLTDVGAIILFATCVLERSIDSMFRIAYYGILFLIIQFVILICGVTAYATSGRHVIGVIIIIHWVICVIVVSLYNNNGYGLRDWLFGLQR